MLLSKRSYTTCTATPSNATQVTSAPFSKPAGADIQTQPVSPGLSCSDFDEFLAILYPTEDFPPVEIDSPTSGEMGFESIKLLASDNLAVTAAPVDKIIPGRRYGISEWLPEAYKAVRTREDLIELGVDDVVKLSAARQAYGRTKPRFGPNQLSLDLVDIFELEGCSEPQSFGPAEDKDVVIKTLEDKVLDAHAAILALPTLTERIRLLIHTHQCERIS
ncbi:hypothetical protein HWV62_33863 [Athelia sp. TMB]|nr:hypothetical protein HWV62_33863 [Athelia sp. TMB]